MIRLSGNHSPSAVCVYLRVGRSLHFARGLDFPVHHPSDAIVIDVVTLVHHRALLVYSIDQTLCWLRVLEHKALHKFTCRQLRRNARGCVYRDYSIWHEVYL